MKEILFNDGTKKKINNVFCIGRNYTDHIHELGNSIEETPVVFLKTNTSIETSEHIYLPPANFSSKIHHEVELVLYISKNSAEKSELNSLDLIGGYAIGLDLTARDLQDDLKEKRLPWTLSKSFKNSGWVSEFHEHFNHEDILIALYKNDELQQKGETKQMIFSIPYIVSYLSNIYGLCEGDLIFTGTPSGVGILNKNDNLLLKLNNDLVEMAQKYAEVLAKKKNHAT